MPLIDSFVFANTRGGCGKTSLCFQAACTYAAGHPDINVVVLDATLIGDTSTFFLGGTSIAPEGDGLTVSTGLWYAEKLQQRNLGTFTSLVDAAVHNPARQGWMGSLFSRGGKALDLDNKFAQVHHLNPDIPQNLFLACGGQAPSAQLSVQLADAGARKRATETLRKGFEQDSERWCIFADTDGDMHFTPYTKLCLALCRKIVVPYETNAQDVLRFSHLFVPQLREMEAAGEAPGDVALIIWNKVSVSAWGKEGALSPVFKSPAEKEKEMMALNTQISKCLGHEVRSTVVPPFDSDGLLSIRDGCPFVSAANSQIKFSRKCDELNAVFDHLLTLLEQDPRSLFD
jgi:hypothetical protein